MENPERYRPVRQLAEPPTLSTLPYDLLHSVAAHIPDARSVAALSQTCKSLNGFIATPVAGRRRGWQVFVQSRFPSIYPSIAPGEGDRVDWRWQAEALTLLSRNYDRRGFVARPLDPDVFVLPHYCARRGPSHAGPARCRWGLARGAKERQTVGFHPVLDTCGNDDVLAVGAGADLLLKRREGGGRGRRRGRSSGGSGGGDLWWVYEDRTLASGRDDITALKLLRGCSNGGGNGGGGGGGGDGDGDDDQGSRVHALLGRASGTLSCVVLQTAAERAGKAAAYRVETVLQSRGKVRAATALERSGGPADLLVASVMGNDAVVLHRLLPGTGDNLPPSSGSAETVVPIASELAFGPASEQPWTAEFLVPGGSVLAVGKNGAEPCAVHGVTPSGFAASPIRRLSAEACVGSATSSVQCIAPFPGPRASAAADLFLAGWYTGATLLHDARSPDPYAVSFRDPLDPTSAVYSILPIGRERVLVGGARHSLLKVFDVRMPGGRVYAYPGSPQPPPPSALSNATATPGWATYLNKPLAVGGGVFQGNRARRDRESPVYSLKAGSPGGAHVFAGVEGLVWEFDFTVTTTATTATPTTTAATMTGDTGRGRGRGQGHGHGHGHGHGGGEGRSSMYEFVGPTKLWKQRPLGLGLGSAGATGACGVLDGSWMMELQRPPG